MVGQHEVSVPSATSVAAAPRQDYDGRVRNYLISMSIRTAAFVAAVLCTGVVRWVCVALAVFLPYVAVVFANARQQRRSTTVGSISPDQRAVRLEHRHRTEPPQ